MKFIFCALLFGLTLLTACNHEPKSNKANTKAAEKYQNKPDTMKQYHTSVDNNNAMPVKGE